MNNSTSQQKIWLERCLAKYYHDRPDWIDGTTRLHNLIREFATSRPMILEIGAGPANQTTRFLASLGEVTGVDIDSDVKSNEYCKKTIVYDGMHIPCGKNSYDLVIMNYVCEHIKQPMELCREIHRVLRPEGFYIFRTPNLWHYISLAAWLTPQFFHNLVANRLRNIPAESHAPYPTLHRMNTKRICRKILSQAGFSIKVIKIIEAEPSYGMASRMLFYPMMIWERVLNSSSVFEILRSNILCVAAADK